MQRAAAVIKGPLIYAHGLQGQLGVPPRKPEGSRRRGSILGRWVGRLENARPGLRAVSCALHGKRYFSARYCVAMSQENIEVVRAAIDALNRQRRGKPCPSPMWRFDWSASRGLDAHVYRGREDATRFVRTVETFESVFARVCLYQYTADALEAVGLSE